jgi:hypothetical protein
VVLGHPEATEPEPFGVPGQVDGGAQGVTRGPAVRYRRQVKHRQGDGPRAEGQGRIVHDWSEQHEAAHSSDEYFERQVRPELRPPGARLVTWLDIAFPNDFRKG